MACRDEPITCRRKIAARFGLTPHRDKSWQFGGACPHCGHGGFSITAGDQGRFPLRHIWHCNCHRCRCDPADVRTAMLRAGVLADCLGSYARRTAAAREGDSEAAQLRDMLAAILADSKVHAPADLRLKVAEVAFQQEVPAGWTEFLAFAERAGVGRRQRYEAAERWGRRKRQ